MLSVMLRFSELDFSREALKNYSVYIIIFSNFINIKLKIYFYNFII